MLLNVMPIVKGFGESGESRSNLLVFLVLSPTLISLMWLRKRVPRFSSSSLQLMSLTTTTEPMTTFESSMELDVLLGLDRRTSVVVEPPGGGDIINSIVTVQSRSGLSSENIEINHNNQ